jgi:lysyl-tRNA synthetase class 1
MKKIIDMLNDIPKNATPEEIQTNIYDIGMNSGYEKNLRDFFCMLYEILLGQSQGPRLGSFIALYGIENSINLINSKV